MKRQCARAATILCLMITMMTFFVIPASAAIDDTPSPVPPPEKTKSTNAKPASETTPLSGKVIETMNSGGYTYIRLEHNGKKTWAAVPKMKVTVGQQISLLPGGEMVNFRSKSLNRTFDSIIFSGGLASGASSATGKQKTDKKASPPAKGIKVAKATGADAYTVSEIYEKRTELHEKNAVVRGQVVKVSMGIMGKNWIHLEDGSGDKTKGTNDLVATSTEAPSVGDVITVKGTVYKDKDFGAGYKYTVIMEKASIQR
jgi:hypothetical protein